MMLSGLRVLLAEDNPTNQLVAVQMLETLGAQVTLAVDGAEALEIVEDRTFDVALIDIEMPRVSGLDLIRSIRTMDGPVADMPLVALTAYVMREHRAAIDEAGADGIIAKPILSIEQFGEEITTLIRGRLAGAQAAKTAAAPPAATAPEAPAGVDLTTFEGLRASFDETTFPQLLEKIVADVGSASDRIAAGLEAEDLTELRAASHILISVAGAIGAHRLQELATCLNSAGHAADTATIEQIGPNLLREAEQVLDFVRSS